MKRRSSLRTTVIRQPNTMVVLKENTNCPQFFLPHRKFRLTVSLGNVKICIFVRLARIRDRQEQGKEGKVWETEKNVYNYVSCVCVRFKRLLTSLLCTQLVHRSFIPKRILMYKVGGTSATPWELLKPCSGSRVTRRFPITKSSDIVDSHEERRSVRSGIFAENRFGHAVLGP